MGDSDLDALRHDFRDCLYEGSFCPAGAAAGGLLCMISESFMQQFEDLSVEVLRPGRAMQLRAARHPERSRGEHHGWLQ